MNRLAVACFTALLACGAPSLQAQAQVNARAYAPENLRTLSVQDQQRVIAQEYAEQSGGRPIPDDQMRFYLDQVNRSSWGFSRIKQDIATSLGGSGGGWNPGGGGNNGVVRCESNDNRQRVCTTGWRSARLSRQISGTRCVEGNNWGSRNGQVWSVAAAGPNSSKAVGAAGGRVPAAPAPPSAAKATTTASAAALPRGAMPRWSGRSPARPACRTRPGACAATPSGSPAAAAANSPNRAATGAAAEAAATTA